MSFSTSSPSVIRFFLNISKKPSVKETIVGYTHNGVIFANLNDDSAWIQFRAISEKQGATPMEVFHDNQIHAINPEAFWLKMFSATSAAELPDVKIKVNIGSISEAEALISEGGCIQVEVPLTSFQLSNGEYKGVPIVYFSINGSLSIVPVRGKETVDAEWIKTCLSQSVQQSSCGGDALSKYRKISTSTSTSTSTSLNPLTTATVRSFEDNINLLIDL